MHKPKPHVRVMQEKELLDGYTRLQQIGPLITIPRTQDRIPNMKKVQILEDRYTQIEKDNRLLLEKITNIMNTSQKYDRPRKLSSFSCRKRSEQEQIRKENLMLFKHITNKKSAYSKEVMDKEWNKTKQYIYNLTGIRSCSQKSRPPAYSFDF